MQGSSVRQYESVVARIAVVALAAALVASAGVSAVAAQEDPSISYEGEGPDVEPGDTVELPFSVEGDYPADSDNFTISFWEFGAPDGYTVNATVSSDARTIYFDTGAAGSDGDTIWAEDADGNEVDVTVHNETMLEESLTADTQISFGVGENVDQARNNAVAVGFFYIAEEGSTDGESTDGESTDGESDGSESDDSTSGEDDSSMDEESSDDGDDGGDGGDGLPGFGIGAAALALFGAGGLLKRRS